MAAGETIVFDDMSKRFGAVHAVSDLTFTVEPGRVTGFLGPTARASRRACACVSPGW
ncbi:MAG: hypothetical protein R2717_08410 [Schumannella sp.]